MKLNKINCSYEGEIKPYYGVLNISKSIHELLNGLPLALDSVKTNNMLKNSTKEMQNFQKNAFEMFSLKRLQNLNKTSFKQESAFNGICQMYETSFSKEVIEGKKLTLDFLKKNISKEDI